MYTFIFYLRALAACLITNAHYVGIYPLDIIANGGLIGDIIFFAVSGFCLSNIKDDFITWYKKRIKRIYPYVWLITICYLLLGLYSFEDRNLIEWFFYPTGYHFVASIIVLYIPYYFVSKKNDIHFTRIAFLITACVQVMIYIFIYDKTYYHIDTVREPFIRFLFFEAMLIGLFFRQKSSRSKMTNKSWILTFILCCIYFISKIIFSKIISISSFQIFNQIILTVLLFSIFDNFQRIDSKLNHLNKRINKIVKFISNYTLEIYLVQYVIIPICSENFKFPLNWLIATFSIVFTAYLLKTITNKILNNISEIRRHR